MIVAFYKRARTRRRLPAVALGLCCASIMGTAHSAVNGMTPAEFTNVGEVMSSASQYENNTTNNSASVVVLPKGMVITKTADTSALSNPIAAGDVITYNFTAQNLGLLPLTNVTISDSIIAAANISLIAGDTNSNDVLDALETWQWQGTYLVTQADIDTNGNGDGDIDNTVTIATDELPAMTASAEVPVVQAPSFNVTKAVDQTNIAAPTTLNYVIEITNTGNQTLSAVTPGDVLPDGSAATLTGPLNDSQQAGVLDPGEVWKFTTTYIASQSDIDAGNTLTNSVSVVTAETGTTAQTASAETEITSDPQFAVSKVVDQASLSAPGTLSYTVTIENTGNVSLTGVTPDDTLPDGTVGTLTGPVADTGVAGVLDVAETWTYTISYPVDQNDIDSGATLTNKIDVVTNETGTTPVSDTASTDIVRTPAFTVSKTVDIATVSAPQVLSYNMEIINTGNVTLTNLVVNDQLSNGTPIALTGPTSDGGTTGALDVGESWQYTATYNVTQTDIDTGADLSNIISVDTDETDPQTATAVTTVDSAPDMQVTKTVDLASVSAPGVLNYLIEVSNTGNISLNNVVLTDTLPDGTAAVLVGPLTDTGVVGTLDVGESWQYTTSYTVNQTDIDAGQPRNNTVSVISDETGADPFTASATTTITSTPAFTVEKTVDQSQITAPGTLTYSIVITNTGNITLTDVSVDDTLPDGATAVLTGPTGDIGIAAALDVGEAWTFTTTYEATQNNLDAGAALINEVTVTTAEAGSASDSAQTTIDAQPGIAIVKAANETEFTKAGNLINYAFLVQNTGNLVLTNVIISDPIADAGTIRCLPPGQPVSSQLSTGPFTMAPGDLMNCTAVRTVQVSDVLATRVDNQASVSAEDPQGNPVEAQSEVITVLMAVQPPVATDDSYSSPVSAVPVMLSGGANDSDVNGDKDPSTVSLFGTNAQDTDGDGDNDTLVVPGEGTWLVDNTSGTVTFTPEAGFTADPTPVNYDIKDRSGLVSNVAVLSIDYPQTAPQTEDDLKINPAPPSPANPTTLNVLADNGNGQDSDPENDLNVQSVGFVHTDATDTDGDGDADSLIVAGEGSWLIDNATGAVTFTPESGFYADPTPVNYTVFDNTGLESNEATITVEYPQTAPLAVDDEKLDQPLAQPVVVPVLANDSDPEDNLDPTTVKLIDPISDASVTVLPVADEGVWRVDPVTGDITFTPDPGFVSDPVPVEYVVSDTTGIESNRATVTVTFEPPARIAGTVWLDSDRDGQIGATESRKGGWTLKLLDDNGNVVATTVTDVNGDYLFENLVPGVYTIEFYNQSGVFIDSKQTPGPVVAGEVMMLPLPVDPSGVVYDSIARTPVEGVLLNLVNATGTVVDPSCVRENQQGQVTMADGLYAFDVFPGAHETCALLDVYRIEIADAPPAYYPNFSSIIRQQGASSCGGPDIGCAISGIFDSAPTEFGCTVDAIAATEACEIQSQPDAPQVGDDTRYFVEFELESGDQNVIFNHLPIDARANDAEILLTKSVDQRKTSIGSLVSYTLTAENLKQVPAFLIEIVDTPPAGFSYVEDSVLLRRSGADAEFHTADDITRSLTATINDSMTLEQIDIEAEETVIISYAMRVGTGVVSGRHVNKATASGPNGEASNEVAASIEVVPDPVLSQATLIGKVFWDRDRDGVQDPAAVTGLRIKSAHYGVMDLPDLPARSGVDEDPSLNGITLNVPVSVYDGFDIATREGTRIQVDADGTITEAHIGDRARGISSQEIRVCTRHTVGIPTLADGSQGADEVEVVEIALSNLGIGEPGIPGARLATASGLVIETDGYGRYNIPDVEAGTHGIGQNYILKVDPASLPDGASFTTENPYVMRLDGMALNKMNFGVLLPEPADSYAGGCVPQAPALAAARKTVEVKLGSIFFDTDDASIRADQRGVVADIVQALKDYGGGAITISANTDNRASYEYNIALAEKRAKTVRTVLKQALGSDLMSSVNVEVDPAAYQESGQ